VTPQEHSLVFADLLGRSERTAKVVEAVVERMRSINATLAALEPHPTPTTEFLCDLLRGYRQRAIERAATVLPAAVEEAVFNERKSEPGSAVPLAAAEARLRWHLSDSDPYVRAAAVAALRERGRADAGLLHEMARDEHDQRFNSGLSATQREDLVAFLRTL